MKFAITLVEVKKREKKLIRHGLIQIGTDKNYLFLLSIKTMKIGIIPAMRVSKKYRFIAIFKGTKSIKL